jgi:cytochrome c biogenesis protein CcdA
MFGLDERIAALNSGNALLMVIGVAVLLGLRHAMDPDHLTAVSTLIASERDRRTRRAATLGLAWGTGHALSLFMFGLPIVLFDQYLPERVTQAAEVLIGIVIVSLAVRLLLRWRQGHFHAHEHAHRDASHEHLHARADTVHVHEAKTRTPAGAFGIGLLHGIGGSAGVGILLVASVQDSIEGVLALFLLATCTAVSMTIASTTFGYTLTHGSARRRFAELTPAIGVFSLCFGAWYALGAVEAVPYVF